MAYLNVEAGIDLHYDILGDPNATETIIFLNGVMMSVESWMHQVPIFEKMGYRILLHDFRGQLKSSKPTGPVSLDIHAQDLAKLLEHLGIDEGHVIGTSYGGEVALRFAIDYPKIVTTLSLVSTASEVDEITKMMIANWKEAALARDGKRLIKVALPDVYSNDFLEKNSSAIGLFESRFDEYDDDFFKGQVSLYEVFENFPKMTDQIHKITAPTCVVCGEDDLVKPVKYSKIIADHIVGSEFITIPNCGHVTIFEKPKTLNSMLLGFIMKNSKYHVKR